ncbi:hypothetical protein [Novosphingobium sp. P6W]|uniref:hypothetical protein n=1 Tax=Novosphingobium sp. P6W TaxID=1609758 RepID=UPI0019650F6C|nr:hypothetical protein [Novosphingobium sp. P6W]
MRKISLIVLPAIVAGCGEPGSKPAAPPAHAELIAHEGELLKLTLTSAAQARLGVVTVRVGGGTAGTTRQASGEIVVPPSSAGGVPTGSLANLQQIGAQQAAADGEAARASAQARLARIALGRAEALVREEAGSVRARDEAAAAAAAADAALGAARRQRQLLGPPISAMNGQPTVLLLPTSGRALDSACRGPIAWRESPMIHSPAPSDSEVPGWNIAGRTRKRPRPIWVTCG